MGRYCACGSWTAGSAFTWRGRPSHRCEDCSRAAERLVVAARTAKADPRPEPSAFEAAQAATLDELSDLVPHLEELLRVVEDVPVSAGETRRLHDAQVAVERFIDRIKGGAFPSCVSCDAGAEALDGPDPVCALHDGLRMKEHPVFKVHPSEVPC